MTSDPKAAPLLAIDGLSIAFGGRSLVRDIGFEIRRGETVCLVGESGSGKSLVANAVMGLLAPGLDVTSGSIILEGTDVTRLEERKFRSVRGASAGIVFQEPLSALNPVMRVGEQIREVFKVHGREAGRAQIHALLARVGFRDPERIARSFPYRLSGGQRQRVMIAIAIALEPRLIIADEPTTALDVTTQAQILDLLKQIRDDNGCGMLFITHDFGVVADIADHVVVMREGETVEAAPSAELFANPRANYTRSLMAAIVSRPAPQSKALSDTVAVDLKDVRKTYRIRPNLFSPPQTFTALAGVTLAVRKGETLGIIGESGSGKSTLAKALVSLVRPDAGAISIEGRDILAPGRDRKALAHSVQMVFQDPYASLNPRRRILDILIDGPLSAGVARNTARADALEMLRMVGLPEDAAGRFPHAFSGGQRQRIAIARALALRPSVLVADEPVSALDVSVQRQILDLFKSIRAQLGLTLVFITHDLRIAAEICDRLAIMREGRVVEYGLTRDIIAAPADPYTHELLASIPGRSRVGGLVAGAEAAP